LTDKQLLQWMFPILLVMLIYLGTWTLSAPPMGEDIFDNWGLRFKQCSYNWWDHSLAIGQCRFFCLAFDSAPLAKEAICKAVAVNLSP
jgi:G protein-coupled receptor 158